MNSNIIALSLVRKFIILYPLIEKELPALYCVVTSKTISYLLLIDILIPEYLNAIPDQDYVYERKKRFGNISFTLLIFQFSYVTHQTEPLPWKTVPDLFTWSMTITIFTRKRNLRKTQIMSGEAPLWNFKGFWRVSNIILPRHYC